MKSNGFKQCLLTHEEELEKLIEDDNSYRVRVVEYYQNFRNELMEADLIKTGIKLTKGRLGYNGLKVALRSWTP